jgi:hypothetical protein
VTFKDCKVNLKKRVVSGQQQYNRPNFSIPFAYGDQLQHKLQSGSLDYILFDNAELAYLLAPFPYD